MSIPIILHIFESSNARTHVSEAQIASQLEVLNSDFNDVGEDTAKVKLLLLLPLLLSLHLLSPLPCLPLLYLLPSLPLLSLLPYLLCQHV